MSVADSDSYFRVGSPSGYCLSSRLVFTDRAMGRMLEACPRSVKQLFAVVGWNEGQIERLLNSYENRVLLADGAAAVIHAPNRGVALDVLQPARPQVFRY